MCGLGCDFFALRRWMPIGMVNEWRSRIDLEEEELRNSNGDQWKHGNTACGTNETRSKEDERLIQELAASRVARRVENVDLDSRRRL